MPNIKINMASQMCEPINLSGEKWNLYKFMNSLQLLNKTKQNTGFEEKWNELNREISGLVKDKPHLSQKAWVWAPALLDVWSWICHLTWVSMLSSKTWD